MTLKQALTRLEALGNEKMRAQSTRKGARLRGAPVERCNGVSNPVTVVLSLNKLLEP